MKQEIIQQIIERLQVCDDGLLDLVLALLIESGY